MLTRILVAVIACAIFTDVRATFAGSGNEITLPAGRTKPRSGLRLSVNTQWVMGSGYRPATVRIAPILGGPAPAERYIEVLLRPRAWYPGSNAVAAVATVHLAQGELFGETTIDIPQGNAWGSLDVEAHEAGKYLDDLEGRRIHLGLRFYYESLDATPSILLLHQTVDNNSALGQVPAPTTFSVMVTPAPVSCVGGHAIMPVLVPKIASVGQLVMGKELSFLPDIRVLAGRFPMSYYNGYITADRFLAKTPATDSEILRLIGDLPYMGICNQEKFPDHWLSLSSVDMVITSIDDLRLLARNYPDKCEVLRTWLSTGTLLCVYGIGAKFEYLQECEQLLEIRRDESADKPTDGWKEPRKADYNELVKAIDSTDQNQNWWQQQAYTQRKALLVDAESTLGKITPPSETPFVHRAVGEGEVVAMGADNPFPATEREWSWLFNSVPSRKWLWTQRHGLSNQHQNQQYWNFLIADMGRAPVVSFLALITLFAVVIGPVNYYVLHRSGRLYLLLVTVPVGALVVTSALFLYATLADGLGIRARVRSYTNIDQRTGRSVSWSRQMYYAGLAPSRGMVFPADAAVYPLDYEPMSNMGISDASRKIVWGEDQNLVSGYFLSRTPSQLLVVEPRRTKAGLLIEKAASESGLGVKNELGVAVKRLLVADQDGRLSKAVNLANGSSTVLEPVLLEQEEQFWSRIFGESRLHYPIGFNPANLENISGFFSGYSFNGNATPVSVDSSVLEAGLFESLGLRSIRPNSYMALTERPPLVSLGVDNAAEKSGFHLVVGTW